MTFIANAIGERGNHFRIRQVLLLRGRRHAQMIFDQPGNEFGVVLLQAMFATEFERIDFAECRMVAAAAFGDIMK